MNRVLAGCLALILGTAWSAAAAPNAIAITPLDPGPTSAEELAFTVVFDTAVKNFNDAEDLSIIHVGTSNADVSITGGPTEYTVTLLGVAGDGRVTLAVSLGSDVADLSNAVLASSVISPSVRVDNLPPQLAGILPADASTLEESIALNIVFTENVLNFDDASDIIITHYGTASTGVDLDGGGNSYTVLINGLSGDGGFTVGLNPEAGLVDEVGFPLVPSDLVATVQVPRVPLAALSVVPETTGPTGADAVDFTVIFSRPMRNFDAAQDLVITHAGTSNTTVQIAGGPTVYTATIGGLAGQGSFTVEVSTESDVVDPFGNPLFTTAISEAVAVDRVAPITLTVVPSVPSTLGGAVDFTVTFSEPVTGFETGDDVLISYAGTSSAPATITGEGTQYTVTVDAITGVGTLSVQANPRSDIADAVGNPLSEASALGTVQVLPTLPAVVSIVPSVSSPTNADSITYTVLFSKAVQNFDADDDVIIEHDGTANETVEILGGPTEYALVLGGLTGDGTVRVSVNGDSDVQDETGNLLAFSEAGATVQLDNTAPGFSLLTLSPRFATAGQTVTMLVSVTEALEGDPELFVSGNAASLATSGEFLQFGYTVSETDPLGPAAIVASGTDLAGNQAELALLEIVLTIVEAGLEFCVPDDFHTADTSADQRIELIELLRVIQLFNSAGFGCGDGADGFAPNSAERACCPHDSDYQPRNWIIGLPELLRMIQFFNVGGYTLGDGADGFTPAAGGAG